VTRTSWQTIEEEMAMELLALLSTTPAQLILLAKDLDIAAHELHPLIRILNSQAFGVLVGRHDGKACVWVSERTWPNAEAAAAGYVRHTERNSLL